MKTTLYIITVVLALQAGALTAGNFKSLSKTSDGYEKTSDVLFLRLIPVTPKIADFNDQVDTFRFDQTIFRPYVPPQADFRDADTVLLPDLKKLAPAVPLEADFE